MAQVKKDNNVSVGVRIRPRNEKEIQAGMPVFFRQSPDGGSVEELDENGVVMKHWPYDYVFGNNSTNEEIFGAAGMKLVDAALEGYNTVIFLYGQTSSGKTFTLFGNQTTAGVVSHAMEYVYNKVKNSVDSEYLIKINYAELYNEELKDLLSPTSNKALKIIEDPHVGPMIQGITEPFFTSAGDVRVLLEEGEQRRHFGETNMNAHSSRSHVIVRLHIESRRVAVRSANPLRTSWGKDRPNCVSTLNLVDLAGSERANKAGTSGETLKEGSFINRSLLTLGTVIANLSEGKLQHIPYRNSKLTRLLATALGGNAKTCMITCISPASGNLAESLNTLRFATRAKRIVNHVQKNEILDMKTLTGKLTLQAAELEHLRQQLELSRQLGFNPDDEDMGESLREKALNSTKKWHSMKFMLSHGAKIISGLRATGMSHLAKTVLHNMRQSLSGKKDIRLAIEDLSTVISTYLSKDRDLLEKVHDVEIQNESNIVPATEEVNFSENEGDLEEMNHDGDIFYLLERGGEDIREQMECASFETENLRGVALAHIGLLQRQLREAHDLERQLRKTIEEHLSSILDHRETIKDMKANELALHRQVDDLKAQRAQDTVTFTEQVKQMNMKLSSLETKTTDKDSTLAEKSKLILEKEVENETLRSQIETLQNDLMAALASKKSVEDELVRSRNEDRAKLEKLRNNMHDILVNQGDTGKKIEMLTKENAELQLKIEVAEDELDASLKMNDQMHLEIVQLRGTISTLRDGEKVHIEKMTAVQNQNDDLLRTVHDVRLEVAQLTTTLSFHEQDHLQAKQKLEIQLSEQEHALTAKEAQLKLLKEKYEAKLSDVMVDNGIKEAEIESLQSQLSSKQMASGKLEQSFLADIARLEKKLGGQSKLCEELQRENTNTAIQIHQIHHKHGDEVRALKSKISELQASIDGIQSYVQTQEKELLDTPQQDAVYDDDASYYGGYWMADSPFSRRNSMTSMSSMLNLHRKDSYISQFYYKENAGDSAGPSRMASFLGRNNSFLSPRNPGIFSPGNMSTRDSILGDDLDVTYVDDLEDNDDNNQHDIARMSSGSQQLLHTQQHTPQFNSSSQQRALQHSHSPHPQQQPTPPPSASSYAPLSSGGKTRNKSVAFRDMSPMSSPAVSTAASDFRSPSPLSQRIEACEDAARETYNQLLDGLNLATTLFEHSVNEDRLLRTRLLAERDRHCNQELHDQVTLTRMQDQETFLQETRQQLQERVNFAEKKVEQIQQRCRQLEAENEQLHMDYHRATNTEQVHLLRQEKLEQQQKETKAKLDMAKLEWQRQMQAAAELRLEKLKLAGQIEEWAEKCSAAETRLLIARQEIAILTAEKDELIRRYLPNLASRQP